jgi:hypothetical protein
MMGAIRKTMAILLVLFAVVLAGVALADEGAAPPKAEDGVQPAPAETAPGETQPPAEAPKLPTPKLTLKSTSLGILPEPLAGNNPSFTVSPDARRFAVTLYPTLIIDGKVIPNSAPSISVPLFSPDSQHYTYTGSGPGSSFIVVDGVLQAVEGTMENLCYSPDSKHLSYILSNGGKKCLVVDGVKGKEYDWLMPYDARDQNSGGFEKKPAATVFSPDSQHVAYAASVRGRRAFMVIDGKEGATYYRILSDQDLRPHFSPDSKHFTYRAEDELHKFILVVDGQEVDHSMPIYSPDSAHTAYIRCSEDAKTMCVVRDDVPGKEYGEVRDPVFSPDGQHLAYTAGIDGRWFSVADGVEGKSYTFGPLRLRYIYSPDSSHLVYTVGSTIVMDGTEHKYDNYCLYHLVFSPDSKNLVVILAKMVNGWKLEDVGAGDTVMLNFVMGTKYDAIGHRRNWDNSKAVAFSPDSKRLVYFARLGTDYFIVVDGTEQIAGAIPYSAPVFDSPTKFHYIGLKGDSEVMLVEVEIGE